jgi:hypothetical protein
MYGRSHQDTCWVVRNEDKNGASNSTFCGLSVPKRRWQTAVKFVGNGANADSMIFVFARPTIKQLIFDLKGEASDAGEVRIGLRRLDAEKAQRAQLSTNFAFGSQTFAGSFDCMRKITFVYRSGNRQTETPASCR